jgi:cell division protein FtsB
VRRLLLVPAIIALAVVYAMLDEASGIRAWLRLRSHLVASAGRIDELRREVEALRDESSALKHDPFATERAIREDLELAKPGEIVVRLPRAEGGTPRIP